MVASLSRGGGGGGGGAPKDLSQLSAELPDAAAWPAIRAAVAAADKKSRALLADNERLRTQLEEAAAATAGDAAGGAGQAASPRKGAKSTFAPTVAGAAADGASGAAKARALKLKALRGGQQDAAPVS
jgi:hypothetical protein